MPRTTTKKTTARHDPLHHVIGKDDELEKYGRVSQPGRRKKSRKGSDEGPADEVHDLLAGHAFTGTDRLAQICDFLGCSGC